MTDRPMMQPMMRPIFAPVERLSHQLPESLSEVDVLDVFELVAEEGLVAVAARAIPRSIVVVAAGVPGSYLSQLSMMDPYLPSAALPAHRSPKSRIGFFVPHAVSVKLKTYNLPCAHGTIGNWPEARPVIVAQTWSARETLEVTVSGVWQSMSVYSESGTVVSSDAEAIRSIVNSAPANENVVGHMITRRS